MNETATPELSEGIKRARLLSDRITQMINAAQSEGVIEEELDAALMKVLANRIRASSHPEITGALLGIILTS